MVRVLLDNQQWNYLVEPPDDPDLGLHLHELRAAVDRARAAGYDPARVAI